MKLRKLLQNKFQNKSKYEQLKTLGRILFGLVIGIIVVSLIIYFVYFIIDGLFNGGEELSSLEKRCRVACTVADEVDPDCYEACIKEDIPPSEEH